MNSTSRAESHGKRARAVCSLLAMLVLSAGLIGCGGGGAPAALAPDIPQNGSGSEEGTEGHADAPPTIDHGTGSQPPIEIGTGAMPSSLSNGGPSAGTMGAFGPVFAMPLIPIHMVLLPDARILAYGSDDKGVQGAQLHYMVYDPETGAYPFMVLPTTTTTDLFCGTQALLPGDGRVILAGGDRTVAGLRNYASADVNFFDPATGRMELQPRPMNFKRWYATGVVNAQGDYVVLGGMDDGDIAHAATATFATTPEIYNPATGWRTLPGAQSEAAYGRNDSNWSYPKAWLTPAGRIAIVSNADTIFLLDTQARGSVQPWPISSGRLLTASSNQPSVMFKPGMVLAARSNRHAQVIDLNAASPTVRDTSRPNAQRNWGSLTLLPDGRVWANGGSSTGQNILDTAVYSSELWDPATGNWTVTASAAKPRLYHGNAILLRDGRVLTGGGGAPGPVAGLNAEIYYPPYLFKKDGSGELASRPVVSSLSSRALPWSAPFTVRMSTTQAVGKVVMLRAGSATHAFNGDQRLIELPVRQNGSDLSLTMPSSSNQAPPGYYLVFVLNADGVPSVGEMVKLG